MIILHVHLNRSSKLNYFIYFTIIIIIINVKSRLNLIDRVNVVLNRTVVVDIDSIFRIKVSCITSVDGIIFWLLV